MAEAIDYDAFAAEYAAFRSHEPKLVERLIRGGEVLPSSSLLEVGCGTGDYAIALQALTGAVCVALDSSTEMLAVARARSSAVEFVHGRAEDLPLAGERFDLVFSLNVIHHLTDRAAYFREAHRVLRQGGHICTVTEDEAMIRSRGLSDYFPETVPTELDRYPGVATLRGEMRATGFAALSEQCERWSFVVADADGIRAKVYSSLRLIPDEAFTRGLIRLAHDLADGPMTAEAEALLVWGQKG